MTPEEEMRKLLSKHYGEYFIHSDEIQELLTEIDRLRAKLSFAEGECLRMLMGRSAVTKDLVYHDLQNILCKLREKS